MHQTNMGKVRSKGHMKRRQKKIYVVHPNLGVTSTKRVSHACDIHFIKRITDRNLNVAILFHLQNSETFSHSVP